LLIPDLALTGTFAGWFGKRRDAAIMTLSPEPTDDELLDNPMWYSLTGNYAAPAG
jgi:hypothetical protein